MQQEGVKVFKTWRLFPGGPHLTSEPTEGKVLQEKQELLMIENLSLVLDSTVEFSSIIMAFSWGVRWGEKKEWLRC